MATASRRCRRRHSSAGNETDADDWLAPRAEPSLKCHLGEFAEANDVVADAREKLDTIGIEYAALRKAWADPEHFQGALHAEPEQRKEFAWQLTKLIGPVHEWLKQMEAAAREWHFRSDLRHSVVFGEASKRAHSLRTPSDDGLATTPTKKKKKSDDGSEEVIAFAAATGDVSTAKLREIEIRLLMLHRRVDVRCESVLARVVAAMPAEIGTDEKGDWWEMNAFRAAINRAKVGQSLGHMIERFASGDDVIDTQLASSAQFL